MLSKLLLNTGGILVYQETIEGCREDIPFVKIVQVREVMYHTPEKTTKGTGFTEKWSKPVIRRLVDKLGFVYQRSIRIGSTIPSGIRVPSEKTTLEVEFSYPQTSSNGELEKVTYCISYPISIGSRSISENTRPWELSKDSEVPDLGALKRVLENISSSIDSCPISNECPQIKEQLDKTITDILGSKSK